jgi:hypothetical protein
MKYFLVLTLIPLKNFRKKNKLLMYKYIFAVCILVTICFGCKEKSNEHIIPSDQFCEILYDLHLADGIYSVNSGIYSFHNDSNNFYNDILKEYGYTFVQFDSALRWYALHPDKLDKIYNDLTTKFNKFEYDASQLDLIFRDTTLNLYKAKQNWALPKDGLTKRIPFDVPVVDSAEYKIFVLAKRYADDESKDLYINAFYWYTDSASKSEHKINFPKTEIERGKRFTLYTTSKFLSNKKVKRLRGWILDDDNSSGHFMKHVDVKVIAIRKHKADVNL